MTWPLFGISLSGRLAHRLTLAALSTVIPSVCAGANRKLDVLEAFARIPQPFPWRSQVSTLSTTDLCPSIVNSKVRSVTMESPVSTPYLFTRR